MPYWLDGELLITQCGPIMRHLARSFPQVAPADSNEELRCDILDNTLQDERNNHMRLCYLSSNFVREHEFQCVEFA